MGEIRLNKFLSDAGFCSRREADRLIEAGKVTVDGVPASMGMKVHAGQNVACGGKAVGMNQKPVLLAVNKPRGIVCTTGDKDRAVNIVEFMDYPTRIYPVGRLDKDSEGLLLMTNQGDIVNKILRCGNAHEKEYLVEVDKPVTDAFIRSMRKGVYLKELEVTTRPCKIDMINGQERAFCIVLTQGLNRQIRRMCGELGYQVRTLKRIRMMNIKLGNLKTGQWREVSAEEYEELMRRIAASTNRSYQDSKGCKKADRSETK